MEQKSAQTYSWWTSAGFVQAPASAPYAQLEATAKPGADWGALLRDAGYRHTADFGGETTPISSKIWTHQDRHLLVEIWNEYESLSMFFVANTDAAAFFATWYPVFLAQAAIVIHAEALSQIATTLVAFVRHGHGEDVIDRWGEQTLDNVREREQIRSAERVRKQQRAAGE